MLEVWAEPSRTSVFRRANVSNPQMRIACSSGPMPMKPIIRLML